MLQLLPLGTLFTHALKGAELLKEEGIEATVINIHTIKPIDEDIVINAAKRTGQCLL